MLLMFRPTGTYMQRTDTALRVSPLYVHCTIDVHSVHLVIDMDDPLFGLRPLEGKYLYGGLNRFYTLAMSALAGAMVQRTYILWVGGT